jgi:hypothetical protein
MKTRTGLVVALFLLSTAATQSYADSDGFYCAGPGYVAYELFNSSYRGRVVHLVRLRSGLQMTIEKVDLVGDFQPHGMRCDADSVTINAWDTEYRIALADLNVIGTKGVKRQYPSENLGLSSKKGTTTVDLRADDLQHRYQLIIENDTQLIKSPNGGGTERIHVRSEIQETDRTGKITTRLLLHEAHDERHFD